MSGNDSVPLNIKSSLKTQLKTKSRRRREGAVRLAAPGAAPRALRNDVLPTLEIAYVALADLRSPARKVRKTDPGHVRELAATMSALGFCVPVSGEPAGAGPRALRAHRPLVG